MPVRVIGMIGVAPPANGATVHIIKGGISPAYLKSYAQAHDEAGFDLALSATPPRRPKASWWRSMLPSTPNDWAS